MNGQLPGAGELLQKSIAYHDPEGNWGVLRDSFEIRATRPERPDRYSRIWMDQPASRFQIRIREGDATRTYALDGDACTLSYNGSETFTNDTAERESLTCERARLLRDYYSYLYGLPMKLKDPGAHLDPVVEERAFHGKTCLVLRATYAPDTGSDTWYFYLDPDTYALHAYQFYHDEEAGDGEYILMEGEAGIGGMRVPRIRKWYRNDTGEFLGSDILEPTR